MWLEDYLNKGKKLYRESTTGVAPKYKANQGYEVTDQSIVTGAYALTNGGDEQGWLYCDKAGLRTMGSWMMACPAIYDSASGTVRPMKDKTQTVDSDYATKTLSSSAGNSHSTVRLAELGGGGSLIPGIIAACPNHASQEQVFFPLATSITVSYARVAWNFSAIEDFSEAEIMAYNPLTDLFTASGSAIWIDAAKSIPNIVFTTAGNDTIFEVQKIGTATRKNITRDLYIVKKCIQDAGNTILYLQGISTYAYYNSLLDVSLTTGPNAWNSPENSAIRTNILTQTKKNILCVQIAEDWYGSGAQDEFRWARIQNYSPLIAAPIQPILKDRNLKKFEDMNRYGNNQTISIYRAS